MVQFQPRTNEFLDDADDTAPTRQRELDRTDEGYICPAWQIKIIKRESRMCPRRVEVSLEEIHGSFHGKNITVVIT